MERFVVTFLYAPNQKGQLQNFSKTVTAEAYSVEKDGGLTFVDPVGQQVLSFAPGEWKWVERESSIVAPTSLVNLN